MKALGVKAQRDPAAACLCAAAHAHGAPQHGSAVGGIHLLHPWNLARGEKAQQGCGVQRRAVGQAQRHGRLRLARWRCVRCWRGAVAAQLCRIQAVLPGKGVVEAPHAAKTAGQRHLRRAQGGVGQQMLGGQQALGLQVLQRRNAQARLEDAPQVPVAHTQALCQLSHRRRALGAAGNQPQRMLQQQGGGILRGPGQLARSHLGPAAQAGAKPGLLGLRRQIEKAAVLRPRRAHGADRAAVDAGGRDPCKELPVKACIAGAQRQVAASIGACGLSGVFHTGWRAGHGQMIGPRPVVASHFRTCGFWPVGSRKGAAWQAPTIVCRCPIEEERPPRAPVSRHFQSL